MVSIGIEIGQEVDFTFKQFVENFHDFIGKRTYSRALQSDVDDLMLNIDKENRYLIKFNNGFFYGETKDSLPWGTGFYASQHKNLYCGKFRKGRIKTGISISTNGAHYRGDFKHGLKSG